MSIDNTLLYFAYGSNMSTRRLQVRIPSARKYCNAQLHGHRLTFHKKGADGSGKCDVIVTNNETDIVHGVVFTFDQQEKPILDRVEGPRYQQRTVELLGEGNRELTAFLYIVHDKMNHTDASLKPLCWYHHHVLYGAQQADLPQRYINAIAEVAYRPDTNKERLRREMAIY